MTKLFLRSEINHQTGNGIFGLLENIQFGMEPMLTINANRASIPFGSLKNKRRFGFWVL